MTIPRNLSKLAQGANTSGVLGTANGGTGLSSVGTNGQVIQSNGTALVFATPSAGAMTLISTQTASNSANISWTGLSGYDKYQLIFENAIPATNGDSLIVNFGTGAGPTYITSGYNNAIIYMSSNSASAAFGGTSGGYVYLAGLSGISNSVAQGASGSGIFTGFLTGNTLSITGTAYYLTSSTVSRTDLCSGGIQANTTAKTAIQITFTAGNITSGKFSLYGISS